VPHRHDDGTMKHTLRSAEYLLPPGAAITLPPLADGVALAVTHGRVWLTQSDSLDDHFLAAGESIRPLGRGRIVVECDGSAPARLRCWTPGGANGAPVTGNARPKLVRAGALPAGA